MSRIQYRFITLIVEPINKLVSQQTLFRIVKVIVFDTLSIAIENIIIEKRRRPNFIGIYVIVIRPRSPGRFFLNYTDLRGIRQRNVLRTKFYWTRPVSHRTRYVPTRIVCDSSGTFYRRAHGNWRRIHCIVFQSITLLPYTELIWGCSPTAARLRRTTENRPILTFRSFEIIFYFNIISFS